MELLSTPIDFLKGVGPARAEMMKKELQIFTYKDLLYYFPFRYVDKSKIFNISELTSLKKLHFSFSLLTLLEKAIVQKLCHIVYTGLQKICFLDKVNQQ